MAASLSFTMAGLAQPSEITVHILDTESGEPIPGASVSLADSFDEANRPEPRTTDEMGQCRWPFPQSKPLSLRLGISRSGYSPKVSYIRPKKQDESLPPELTVLLEKARTIGGQITDEDGMPVAGADIYLSIRSSAADSGDLVRTEVWEHKAVSGADGGWSCCEAPAHLRSLRIQLAHSDFISGVYPDPAPRPEELFAQSVTFTLKRGRRIAGIVRDPHGTPLPEATVRMHQHGTCAPWKPVYSTDADGRFVIKNAPPQTPYLIEGKLLLSFSKKGFAPELLTLPAGKTPEDVSIVLSPGHRLAGKIVDAQGKALAGAWVITTHWREFQPFSEILVTDEEGKFVWEDAPADEVIFDILKEGYNAQRSVPMQAGEREWSITLQGPVQVRGTVVDAGTGQPIPSFTVMEGTRWSRARIDMARERSLEAKEGRFEWTLSEPALLLGTGGKRADTGIHFLRVEAPGYAPADSRSIEEGEGSVELRFELTKGAEVPFLVVTKDHMPVPNAVVGVDGEGNGISLENGVVASYSDGLKIRTDLHGRITLPPLPGNPNLVIAHPEFGYATVTAEEARNGEVVLTGWGKVIVKSSRSRRGKEGFYLRYTALDAPEKEQRTDYRFRQSSVVAEDGTEVFPAVKPGPVRIGIFGRADDEAVSVQVPENGEVIVPIEARESTYVTPKLNLPLDADPETVQAELRSRVEEQPWPKGLSIREREKWLADYYQTPEGMVFLRGQRVFPIKFAQGKFPHVEAAPGKYRFTAKVFAKGNSAVEKRLLGVYTADVDVRSISDLKDIPCMDDFGGMDAHASMALFTEVHPQFYAYLKQGDRLPAFSLTTLDGESISSANLMQCAILFWDSASIAVADFAVKTQAAARRAEQLGLRLYAINLDEDEATAKRFGVPQTFPCPIAWVGTGDGFLCLEKFGPVAAGNVLAIDKEGTILGRFQSLEAFSVE